MKGLQQVPSVLAGGKFRGKVFAVREDGAVSDGIFYSKLVGAVTDKDQKACIDDLITEGFHTLLPVADILKWPLEIVRYARDRLVQEGYLAEALALSEGYSI